MPKNIVICCDGTGNQFGACNSNVVKLYTALTIDNEQVGYYHPGVGTMGAPTARNRVERFISKVNGLAFGGGFRDNVLDAYRFLMDQYDDGDQVFLFGFSRGAYTARALAGLLHGYGLLCKGNDGHIPYVWKMFTEDLARKRESGQPSVDVATAFKATFSHPNLRLAFVGLWDTVSSVGWIYEPLKLLYMAQNPVMRVARHAVSIDERRCFFQDNLWGEPLADQDIRQVWFAGVHSDVGGSYPQRESAMANQTLRWMLDEAKGAGLLVSAERERMLFGEQTTPPLPAACLFEGSERVWPVHRSLCGAWWLLELVPHRYASRSEGGQQRWRIPLGRSREIPDGAVLHPSVRERLAAPEFSYSPRNVTLADLQTIVPGAGSSNTALAGYDRYRAPARPARSPAQNVAGPVAAVLLIGAALLTVAQFTGR